MRPFRLLAVLSFLILSLIHAEAQDLPVQISVPLQFFGGVSVKGSLRVSAGGEIEKSSRFLFALSEKPFRLDVTGYTLSLYPDRTGYATIYFGEDITDSDYVQVTGEIVTTEAKRYMVNARVTLLRLNGVNVRP